MSNRLASWIIFYFVVLNTLLATKGPNDHKVLADFPAGCNNGPGMGEGSDMKVASNVCVYTVLDGDTAVSGIRIKTNEPGKYGTLVLELGTTRNGQGQATRMYERTSGWTHLMFKYGNVTARFNPAPGGQMVDNFEKLDESSLYLPNLGLVSYAEVTFPDKQEINEGWWIVTGYGIATPTPVGTIMMHYGDTAKAGSQGSIFRAKLVMMQMQIPGGWYFNYEFGINLVYYISGVRLQLSERAVLAQGHMFNTTAK